MARHIFLTGQKQVGKSTLLRKILDRYSSSVGGFVTVRTDAYLKDNYSVHIYPIGAESIPGENNLLFVCRKSNERIAERFDYLGCEILSKCTNSSLIVMDELGTHEADAALFHAAVLGLLDGNIPILGVLQAPAESFWPDIVQHPDVQVIEVNEHNRNDATLINDILSVFTSENE